MGLPPGCAGLLVVRRAVCHYLFRSLTRMLRYGLIERYLNSPVWHGRGELCKEEQERRAMQPSAQVVGPTGRVQKDRI
jgi:hypothetical protein